MDGKHDAPKEPSFSGKLRIQDYMFSNTTEDNNSGSATARRSTRLLANASGPGRGSLSPTKALQPPSSSSSRNTNSKSPINRKRTTSSSSAILDSTSRSRTASPSKRTRVPSSYAPPSTYAHLSLLPDAILPDPIILFIGLNPGISTARQGHAYAHPSNHFWKLLASSRITPIPCTADEDRSMPSRFSLGLTNIVARPSRNGAELSKNEMDQGVAVLEGKCWTWRPEAVCIVGKSIWESIYRVRNNGRGLKKGEFSYGWQDGQRRMGLEKPVEETRDAVERDALAAGISVEVLAENIDEETRLPYEGARIFVASSTSGLAATLKPAEKEAIWKELGDWCVERRRLRT